MKKMLAMICALALSCTALASCSSSDDSSAANSAAETTAAAEQSAAETSKQTETPEVQPTSDEDISDDETTTSDEIVEFKYDGELFSETYTEKLREGHFSLTASIESEMFGEKTTTVSLIECAGLDFHQKTTDDNYSSEMYLYDKNLYILNEEKKTYTVMDYSTFISDDPSENASMAMGLTDELVLTNRSETEDGLIAEEYTYNSPFVSASDFADGQLPKYVYYFKDNGDIVKIDIIFNGTVQVYNISDVDFDFKEITMPDLSDWKQEDDGTGLTEEGTDEVEESTAEVDIE